MRKYGGRSPSDGVGASSVFLEIRPPKDGDSRLCLDHAQEGGFSLHKVILVEHEERIRHELLEPVDWKYQSFEIVGETRKGRGALHLHAQ
jgi:hypothetical protein